MKIRSFTSLAALNEFLVNELGVTPMDESMLPDDLRQHLANDEAEINVSVAEDDSAAPDRTFAKIDLSDVIGSLFGGAEAGPGPEDTVPTEEFNSYVEFTSAQITRLVEERDDARKLVELERQSHLECHEHMQLHIHQIRVQGYAEALAAGLFPGVPFEDLSDDRQEVLMRQAHAGVERIDGIRGQKAGAASASVH